MTTTLTDYRTPEACRLAGVTYRQADHWARCGTLVPAVEAKGSGTQRRYTGRQVRTMWALGRLALLGLPASLLREAAATLCDAPAWTGWLILGPDGATVADDDLDAFDAALGRPLAVTLDLAAGPKVRE